MNQGSRAILAVVVLTLVAVALLAFIMVIVVVGQIIQPPGPSPTPTAPDTRVVSGMVRDAITGQPIPQAQVRAGTATVLADDDGTFSIAVPAGEVLHVSAANYEDQAVPPEAATVELVRTPPATYDLIHEYQVAHEYGRQYDLLHPDAQAQFSRDDYVRYMERTVDYEIVARTYAAATILPMWTFQGRTHTDVAQVPFTLTIRRAGRKQTQDDVGYLARVNGTWRWFRGPITPTTTTPVWPISPTPGEQPFPVGSWVQVTAKNLNLRTGPGTGYASVTVVSYGTRLRVLAGPTLSDSTPWYQVTDEGAVTGWCNGTYLALSSPATVTPTVGPWFPVGSWVLVSSPDGRLNVRQGPGTGYVVVAVAANGTRLRIVNGPVTVGEDPWYEVTDESASLRGWGDGRYLVPSTPPPTATPTVGPWFPVGSWVQVSSPSGRLNIRQGPGASYAVVAVVANGTRLRVVGGPSVVAGTPWYEVVDDPQTFRGWCSSQYLTPISPPSPTATPTTQPDFPPGTLVLVASPDGQLNVRTGPGAQYAILRTVPNGTRLRIVQGPTWADGSPWYLITDEGQTFQGWCDGRYLVPVPVTVTPTAGPGFPVGAWVQAQSPDGELNIRQGPGTSYPVVHVAHNGDLFRVLAGPTWVSNSPWYQMTDPTGAVQGWGNGLYLALVSATPTPTLSPGGARFTELQFCVIPPGGGAANCSGNYPHPTYEVYIVWDYENMQPGMTVRREWYFNGQHLRTIEEPWDYARYGARGTVWDVRMWNNNGIEPGTYRMELYLNNVKQQERSFTISR